MGLIHNLRIKKWLLRQSKRSIKDIHEEIWHARSRLYATIGSITEVQWTFRPTKSNDSIKNNVIHLILNEQWVERIIRRLGRGKPYTEEMELVIDHGLDFRTLLSMLDNEFNNMDKSIMGLKDYDASITHVHKDYGKLDIKGWLSYDYYHLNVHRLNIQNIQEHPDYPPYYKTQHVQRSS